MSQIIVKHDLDPETLESIKSLRVLKINVVKEMLKKLDDTKAKVSKKYDELSDVSVDQVRMELEHRLENLQERLDQPNAIFADELSEFVELLDED